MKALSTILLLSFSLILSAQDCEEGCYKRSQKKNLNMKVDPKDYTLDVRTSIKKNLDLVN
mgnify:CR=1 FL=1